MPVNCNEVQSANVDTDYNQKRMNDILSYWNAKPNIKKRFTNREGIYESDIAERNLGSWVSDILGFDFRPEQNFTDKQLERLKVSIDGLDKDLYCASMSAIVAAYVGLYCDKSWSIYHFRLLTQSFLRMAKSNKSTKP